MTGKSRCNLIGSALPGLHPARPYPLKATHSFLCAIGVVTTRHAEVGAYLRVMRSTGPLTSVYIIPFSNITRSGLISSYNIPRKAMLFRPFGPGRRRFCRGEVWARCRVLATLGPGACDGRYLYLFSERAAVRPLHAKAFSIIHRVPEDKDPLWNGMNRAIKKGG
uniref:Uncharacterized protein n=1 Tax=Leclercia adecarboxylata TaxID=83655 RepID=A0A7D5G226_9ENTR|nr:hypothetical protein [Leclercia adecarboxylata]